MPSAPLPVCLSLPCPHAPAVHDGADVEAERGADAGNVLAEDAAHDAALAAVVEAEEEEAQLAVLDCSVSVVGQG